MTRHRPPKRPLRLTPDAMRIVDDLRARFHQKFERPLGPGDPLFFDAVADAVDPADQPRFDAMLISAMAAVGVDPAIIAAYRRTGRLLTEQNIGEWSRQERRWWRAMIEGYRDPEDALHDD
jgi:hypothetical protein